jgi:hypothetical protein
VSALERAKAALNKARPVATAAVDALALAAAKTAELLGELADKVGGDDDGRK